MDGQKKAPSITIYTLAYNAENYINECAKSVLNQTFTDFEWLVLDNGCTDKTSEILREYAKEDSRIRLFKNEKNFILYNEPINVDFLRYRDNLASEYWCTLDSDDYIHPDFLKELYMVAKKYDADIVVGGAETFKEENPEHRVVNCPRNFYIEDIAGLGDMFPQIYGFFRPMWGKLFKVSVVKRIFEYRKQNPLKVKNGGDTIFCLECLKLANSIAGVNKVFYYYRERQNSLYHSQVDKERFLDYEVIYNESKKLLKKWDKLNQINLNFIARVLYVSMKSCMDIAANSESIPVDYKLEVIQTILTDVFFNDVVSESNLSEHLLQDAQNVVESIIEKTQNKDMPIATTYFVFRLFKSIKMGLSLDANKQNAFLLYVSSICDQDNKNLLGAKLLYNFLMVIGKKDINTLQEYGISSEFLASNPVLLREIVNSSFDNVEKICEENLDKDEYKLLKQVLKLFSTKVSPESLKEVKDLIGKYISDGNFDEAVDLLIKVLYCCPLDKDALYYKLYLLTMNGDVLTAVETAEVLRVFYPDDSNALILAAQAFIFAGLKDRAKKVFKRALDICIDETQRIQIIREIDAI